MSKSKKRIISFVVVVCVMLSMTVMAMAASGSTVRIGDGITMLGNENHSNQGFALNITKLSTRVGTPRTYLFPFASRDGINLISPDSGTMIQEGSAIWANPYLAYGTYELSVRNFDWECYIDYNSTWM